MAGDRIGVLLDLDDTLVLTSEIESLRQKRAWSYVYAAFSRTSLPFGTREFVAIVTESWPAGVVTTSPRTYAERLLRYHRLDLPVLAAYHDTRRHKPFPDPLVEGARLLGLPVTRCVHIGDDEKDAQAATAAGMTSILVAWGAPGPGVCRNWAEVLTCLRTQGRQ